MDIHKWLNNTADRVPPDLSDDANKPDFLQHHHENSDRLGRNYRRKRKRASSDSSVIAPRPTTRLQARAATSSATSNRFQAADDSSGKDNSSQHLAPIQQQHPPNSYEKRARRKTKPDRYEPKSNKQRKEGSAKKERKFGQKRRKSHRSGDGGRTTELVQSFHLNNGPKNNRLTLKQDANIGIFAHGKASAQMTGRGSGLPDLVFNELKFLQKAKDFEEGETENAVQRKADAKNQSNKRKRQDEEVSAYFDAQRAANVQRRAGLADERQSPHGQAEQLKDRSDYDQTKPATPPVELPEKAFLGFGSKGEQHQSQHPPDGRTSYYTWSKSAPPNSLPARERPLPDAYHERGRDKYAGQWLQSRRTSGLAVVEVYRPASSAKYGHSRRRTSATKSTQQSLPRLPSARVSSDDIDTAEGHWNQLLDRKYRTSDILDVKDPQQISVRYQSLQYGQVVHPLPTDKENQDPNSSFSVDKLLSKVRDSVNKPRSAMRPLESTSEGLTDPRTTTAQQPVKRPSRKPFVQHAARTRYEPESYAEHRIDPTGTAYLHGSVTYASTKPPTAAFVEDRHDSARKRPNVFTYPGEDDEMLDCAPDVETAGVTDGGLYANGRQAEDLAYGMSSERGSGLYGLQADRLHRDTSFQPSVRSAVNHSAKARSVRGVSIEQEFASERSLGITGEGVDEFAGFWKPHRLY